jgi:hypothetical protein
MCVERNGRKLGRKRRGVFLGFLAYIPASLACVVERKRFGVVCGDGFLAGGDGDSV